MAYFFGAGMATDAFVVAFRIPNLLRDLFAEGALSSSFVPVFKDKLVQETKEDAFRLANTVLTAMVVVIGFVTLLGLAATPMIVYLTANGYTEDAVKFALTVNLTRIMWFFLPLVSLSALIMGMLNSFDRYGIPALSPAMFNIGSILSVFVLYRYFEMPIYTLAIGVLVGGIGQIVVQIPSLREIGYRFRFRLSLWDEGLKKMMRLFGPMMIGLSASRINILVSTLLVSFLAEGSISYLNYAFRLMHFPLGVFAVALGTVALPRASEQASRKDMEGLGNTVTEALTLNFMLIVPSAVALALLAPQLVQMIYQYGAFSATDADNTSLALLHYSYGIIGAGAVRVLAPAYYALGDAKWPMFMSIGSVALNIFLYYPLIKVWDFAGLAAATSIASLANFGLLLYFLQHRGVVVPYNQIWTKFIRILAASAIAFGGASFIPLEKMGLPDGAVGRLIIALVPLAVGMIAYIVLCKILKVKEIAVLKDVMWRRKKTLS
jgi:putative peptidoglycan lipid II flippase